MPTSPPMTQSCRRSFPTEVTDNARVSALPDRLGRYAVRRRIGSGGFATVWLAYDEQLDSPVAVKVLADNWTEDHHVRTRFVEEGRFLRRVESPHVVTVYDAGELDDGRPYLVMTYADQGTLADRLEIGGLEVAEAIEVVRQVGAGLQALHDRGILHRDVKPANVLFRSVGNGAADPRRPRDARRPRPRQGARHVVAADHDRRHARRSSPPSRRRARAPTPRADQYSLGVLTYLLLTGRTPWRHADLTAAATPGPPPPLSSVDRQFPDEVDDVVRRALSPDPADRWPTSRRTSTRSPPRSATGPRSARQGLRAVAAARPRADPARRPAVADAGDRRARPTRCRRAGGAGSSRWRAVTVLALGVGAVAGWFGFRALDRRRDGHRRAGRADRDRARRLGRARSPASRGPRPARTRPTPRCRSAPRPAGPTPSDGEGVFAGIMPGDDLPDQLPGHPGATTPGTRSTTRSTATRPRTIVLHRLPGGVTVERVVQVAANRLLWVQVRSADRATANDVLESRRHHGL